jgi:predicted Fe-Mo cluster-binding NifX family protein
MERIAIPRHLDRVSPVFDVARNVQIFEVEDCRARREEERPLHSGDPYLRAKEVQECRVTTIICGAISRALDTALHLMGISVLSFMRGQIDEVAGAFAEGWLSDPVFLMPGCYGRPRCRRRPLRRNAGDHSAKGGNMKIAVTSADGTIEGAIDERFGRCRKFVVYETGSKGSRVFDNTTNLGLAQGAGIQTAQNIVRAGAEAVISGHVGPKAFQVLKTAGIEIYMASNMSVGEALTRFEEGRLTKLAGADVEGHW